MSHRPDTNTTRTYLGVDWDVLAGYGKGYHDRRECQDTELDPEQRSLGSIHRLERKGTKGPDIAVCIHTKYNEQDQHEVSRYQFAQAEAAHY